MVENFKYQYLVDLIKPCLEEMSHEEFNEFMRLIFEKICKECGDIKNNNGICYCLCDD